MSWGTRKPRILVVDDDPSIVELVSVTLIEGDYEVRTAENGASGLALLHAEPVDLVICDVNMPLLDGLQFCQQVRAEGRTVPILLVTALDSEADEAAGLAAGADDYLPKPMRTRVLLTRVDALLRYDVPTNRPPVQIGQLRIDGATVTLGKRKIEVTPPELRLLESLTGQIGTIVGADVLMQAIRGADATVDASVLDRHVRRLRRKLETADPGFDRIENVPGMGVRWRK